MRAANMPNPHRPVTRKNATMPSLRRHAVIAYDAWMSAPRVTLLLCLACNASTPAPEEPVPALPPPPPTTPVRPIVGELGTAHPLVLLGVPPTGQWLAFCQARSDTDGNDMIYATRGHHGDIEGDEMLPYFARAAGEGEPIEEFAGSDPGGRYAAFYRRGELVLFDSWQGAETVLFVVDRGPLGQKKRWPVSFSRDGARVGYARRAAGTHDIVVRDTATGTSRTIAAGTAALWGFHLEPDGASVVFSSTDRDTNGDGEITPPIVRTTLSDAHCRAEAMSWGNYGFSGDEPQRKVASVADGTIRDEPQGPDAPPDDPVEPRPIVSATDVLELDPAGVTVRNLATGRRRPLPVFLWNRGPGIDQGALSVHMQTADRAVVLDHARAGWLGHVDGWPLALATTGEVLVARGFKNDHRELTNGPLRWVAPRPLDDQPPPGSIDSPR